MTKMDRSPRLVSADQVFAKSRKSPGYQKAYEALEEEFSLVSALIKARQEAGLTRSSWPNA